MIKTATITGLGYSLSPIVHNEVMAYNYNPRQGEAKKQRTMPIAIVRDGQVVTEMVPVVSGNCQRGIGRRLLVDHTLDVLGIKMDDLFSSKEEARRVLYFLRNGGLTPSGIKTSRVTVGTYESIQSNIPMLQVLGGVYQGHHFEGHARVSILVPMTKETYPLYENMLLEEHKKIITEKGLPSLSDIMPREVRYTRRADNEKASDDKEAMVYGTEVLPAGIHFITWLSLVTSYESALLAFKAMAFLIKEYGFVGGMIGRGHGKILYDYKYVDQDGQKDITKNDYDEYVKYVKEHKDEIITAIKSIPAVLKWEIKQNNQGE